MVYLNGEFVLVFITRFDNLVLHNRAYYKIMFINRLKSFAWRLGAFVVVAGLGWISENAGLLELSPAVTTVIALVVGEVTKYLNTKA